MSMTSRMYFLMAGVMLLGSATATAQSYTPYDTSQQKGPVAGNTNAILVLGTPHLSGMSDTFTADQLEPVLERLAAWKPQAIAIEAISGPQCHFMRQYPDRYAESVEAYCADPAAAQAATGLDVPAATAAWHKALSEWPDSPTSADRRRLASLFLAGGEGASALVQWLRLPEAERRAGDGLDDALVARLERLRVRKDESILIAAVLAARLGLERVYAMDDHTADFPVPDSLGAAYEAAISAAWDNPATEKRIADSKALEAKIGSANAMLDIYRYHNGADQAQLIYNSDFGAALNEPSGGRFGRSYLGYWETRNLRMAANIRDMFAFTPGMRGLVIVGASHKAYIENYLDQMHDITVADAMDVLK
jgi:hypothetical protein